MIRGTVIKIQSQMENDWGRYTLDVLGEEKLAVGVIPGVSLGMMVTLEGGDVTNKYGHQFKITSVLATEDDVFSGIRTFLSGDYVKGIGAKKANDIIRTFGKEGLDLFETAAGRKKLEKIKGLGSKSVEKAYASYLENRKYKDIVLFLNGAGTKAQVERIYSKYGDKSIKTLRKNPYILQMDLSGFGFKKTDAIALNAGVKKTSVYRIMAGIKYMIEEAQTSAGHCYLPIDNIKKDVLPLLAPLPKLTDVTEKVAENALENWLGNREKLITEHAPSAQTLKDLAEVAETRALIKEIIPEALSKAIEEEYLYDEDGKIYTSAMHFTENAVATALSEMCNSDSKPVRDIPDKLIEKVITEVENRKTEDNHKRGDDKEFKITDEQRTAVYLGLKNRVCIISGGPGRGKTAISEIIAKTFIRSKKYGDNSDVLMLAPTGKAARRITESTGYSAMTIHRAVLAIKNKEGLPEDKLILVDESSMIDIYLMHNLLKFAKNCNLIFVGDVYQIAPVGPGKALKDLIDSDTIPYIILKKGHRNSGSISRNAELINAGYKHDTFFYDDHFVYKPFKPVYEITPDGKIAQDRNGNFIMRTRATEFMKTALIDDYMDNIKKYGIQNVMMCAAMKERGDICTARLNDAIQDRLTSGRPEARFGKKLFRLGDRVMQTKNNYQFVKMTPDKSRSLGVCNGETGTVVRVSYDHEIESPLLVVQFDDGCYGGYTKATASDLQLAYAITIHKCQGSEAACVMLAFAFSDYILLNRSLFYTGETRSKKVCYLYGEERLYDGKMTAAIDIAISKNNDVKRNTMLSERLKDLAS